MIYRSSFRKNRIYFHLAVQISERHLTQKQTEVLWKDLARRFRRHKFLHPHCCVLMSNHFHAIFETPDICYEMAESALQAEFQQVARPASVIERKDFFRMDRIQCFAAYRQIYRYIYRNPLEAGLCARAEYYPFSSLAELIGFQKSIHCVSDSMGVITNPFRILDWINSADSSNSYFH